MNELCTCKGMELFLHKSTLLRNCVVLSGDETIYDEHVKKNKAY